MPPSKVSTGGSNGRTLAAMVNRAAVLIAENDTRAMGLQLKEYAKDMYVFNEFRGFKPYDTKYTDMDELRGKLTTMLKHVQQLPAALSQYWLGKVTNRLASEGKWAEYAAAMDPYAAPRKFVLDSPRLADVPRVPMFKCLAFRSGLFAAHLGPLIHEGKSRMPHIKSLCKAALLHLKSIDVLELDEAMATDLRENIDSLAGLQCLALADLSVTGLTELRWVYTMPSPVGVHVAKEPAAVTLQKAIKAWPFWNDRALLLLDKAEPTLRERHTNHAQLVANMEHMSSG